MQLGHTSLRASPAVPARRWLIVALLVLLMPWSPAAALDRVSSWGYQLQNADLARIAGSPHEVVIIDYSRDGSDGGAYSRSEIERLKVMPDGRRRRVVAYLSIGEAEEYRYYWRFYWGWLWGWFAPSWRASLNAEWAGNYAVRYWDDGWQQLIVGSGGYLDKIVKAGFDGVWLDKIDSSLEAVAAKRPTARADMIAFVRRIAERGRAAQPGFLVIPQNGDELLVDPAYRALIDSIGKEDLLYSEETDGKPNSEALISARIARLQLMTAERKSVLAVEYLDDPALIKAARARLTAAGFVAHFAPRGLDHMRLGDLPEPGEKPKR
jgi:cysteinyl-tRNA synthetase, unknown class